jgi:energy-coupling factor transport system ATP-binding protein
MADKPIVVDHVDHIYPGDVHALKDASLEVGRGEVLGVVGQNGCGKTTMVKHFNGLLKPSRGRVLIEGRDTAELTVNELSKDVGYVFQNPNHQLFATRVNLELEFGPKNIGLEPDQVEERVQQAADFFDIHHVMDKHPYRLSFPYRKLVAMASIYAMQPSIFVLDEPTTGQDHQGSNMVRKLVNRLREQGSTVVIVSHDMALIAEVADRVVALWAAEIIALGTPREIFSRDDVMEKTKLHPPQITQFSRRMGRTAENGLALTVPEAVEQLTNR